MVEYIDGKPVEFDLNSVKTRDIVITDTTFRDGQQARPPYTIDQMVKIYDLLARLGGPNGVIRQTEFFLYTKNDRETLDRCRELGHKYPECTGWIRAVKGDFRLVKEAGLKETGMLTSCSDYHIFQKLKFKSRQECMDSYCEVVDAAFEAGVRPRCHLEDITRADIDGFVLPFVDRLMEMSEQVPDELKVKIRLCDTMGFGVHYPGVELPRSIPKLIYKLNQECGVPSDRLEWHGHNDFHKVHVNGATAWLYGCDAVERHAVRLRRADRQPAAGRRDHGVHRPEGRPVRHRHRGDHRTGRVHAVDRLPDPRQLSVRGQVLQHDPGRHPRRRAAEDERIYNIFDTTKLLNRPPRVALTDKSGADGVALWVNEFFGLKGDDRISKIKFHKLARWVMDQYEKEGRMTAISDQELETKTRS